MSHLGYKILYKILNDDPRTLAERCYTPGSTWSRVAPARMPLVSLESALCASSTWSSCAFKYELTSPTPHHLDLAVFARPITEDDPRRPAAPRPHIPSP
jgi:hypothetical protein